MPNRFYTCETFTFVLLIRRRFRGRFRRMSLTSGIERRFDGVYGSDLSTEFRAMWSATFALCTAVVIGHYNPRRLPRIRMERRRFSRNESRGLRMLRENDFPSGPIRHVTIFLCCYVRLAYTYTKRFWENDSYLISSRRAVSKYFQI